VDTGGEAQNIGVEIVPEIKDFFDCVRRRQRRAAPAKEAKKQCADGRDRARLAHH
jgi:hypothetical protein